VAGNFFDQFDSAEAGSSSPYANAISTVESGGNYREVGPHTGNMGRALGKYQIMSANVGPWSKEVLGREVSPREFINDPGIQDAIFNGKFGQYVDKYGPDGAARAWFAGEGGMNNPNARDVFGTTVSEYSRRFNRALGSGGGSQSARDAVRQFAPSGGGSDVGSDVGPDVMAFAASEKPKASAAQPEARNFFDQFDEKPAPTAPATIPGSDPSGITIRPVGTVAERSDVGPAPQNADALRQGLTQLATEKTRGEPTSNSYKIAMDFLNQGSAAGQRTTPIISAHQPNLISTEVHENDAGELLYVDPQTGQLVKTDSNKHVALRDPADGVIKVFARTPDTDEGVLSSAGRILGTGLAAAAPTVRPAMPLPQMVKTATPSLEALKGASNAGYQAIADLGVKWKPAGLNSLADEIHNALRDVGYRISTAPKTFGAIEELRLPKGQATAEFADIDAARRVLQKAGIDPTEKDAVRIAREAIDAYLENPRPDHIISGDAERLGALAKDARGNYAAVKRSEAVAEAGQKAARQAEKAGSGGNIDNATRQQIDRILNNPKRLRGFSKDEIQQMRDIVKGTRVGNNARLLGKLAPTGVVSGALSVGAGFGAGGGIGAIAFPAIGLVAKRLGDSITKAQLAKLDELVRSNSPLARAAESSSLKWTRSADELVKNPSTPKIASFLLLTRNLSNTLKLTGIDATPDQLFKSLQIGGTGRAEDQQ
jgi:hypothetical protein